MGTLLGGKVKLFVPACVVRELRALCKDNAEFQAAASLARKFMRHKDNCSDKTSNTECLLQQVGTLAVSLKLGLVEVCAPSRLVVRIGNGNSEHWWLATQDKEITGAVRKVCWHGGFARN